MKVLGVSVWIWVLGGVVSLSGLLIVWPMAAPVIAEMGKPLPLEVVKDSVWSSRSGSCEVRGQIYNPRKDGARNVRITYKLWVSKLGKKDELLRVQKGTASATLQYLPPGETVDFTAYARETIGEFESPFIDGFEIEEKR